MVIANNNQSPCLTCTRVKDPPACENKTCRVWVEWFSRKWDAMREANLDAIRQLTTEE